MGLSGGTNNYTELLAVKYLIHFALNKQCSNPQLFGDSKIVCNWLNKKSHCNAYTLRHILDDVLRLITNFDSFICQHIYRERKSATDHLSKEATPRDDDTWMIQEERDGVIYQHYHRLFIDPGA